MSFFSLSEGFMKPCDFFFDIDFSELHKITFLGFFEEFYSSSAFMLIDVNL